MLDKTLDSFAKKATKWVLLKSHTLFLIFLSELSFCLTVALAVCFFVFVPKQDIGLIITYVAFWISMLALTITLSLGLYYRSEIPEDELIKEFETEDIN